MGKKGFCMIICLALALSLLGASVSAQEAYVFTTSKNINDYGVSGGNLQAYASSLGLTTGVEAADYICNQEASVSLNTNLVDRTFKAWMADSSFNPSDRMVHASIPYKLVDDTLIANDWNDLVSEIAGNYLQNPINKDQYGNDLSSISDVVLTGTGAEGTEYYGTCNSWASENNFDLFRAGNINNIDSTWAADTTGTCDTTGRLYCFEQPSQYCGNDVIDGSEVCDGTDLGGQDCLSLGFTGGTLSCKNDCSDFNTGSCISACEDGIDNDGDFLIDLLDPGCTGVNDNNEYNLVTEFFDTSNNDFVICHTIACYRMYFDTCGDGIVEPEYMEQCDDGKHCSDGTACTQDSDCTTGDTSCLPRSDDGCDNLCISEITFCGDSVCTGAETFATCPEDCQPVCGDGLTEGTEQCDDGNTASGDGCDSTCELECYDVTDGMVINTDTKLCDRIYTVDDSANDGIITIAADSILLDCNSARIISETKGSGIGIMMENKNNVLIRNCEIFDFDKGILMQGSSSNNEIILSKFSNDQDITVTGSNNLVYLNSFYKSGISDSGTLNNYCFDDDGNFYEEDIPYSNIGDGSGPSGSTIGGDCGPSNITEPAEGVYTPEGAIDIAWTEQSSLNTITYHIEYSVDGIEWLPITSTSSQFSHSWTIPGFDPQYLIRVRPTDGFYNATINQTNITLVSAKLNGTVTNCEVGSNVEGANIIVSGNPSIVATTDVNGFYEFERLYPGVTEFYTSKQGYANKGFSIDFSDVNALEVEYDLCISTSNSDCLGDCTQRGNNICDPDCVGISGCSYVHPTCEYVANNLKVPHPTNESRRLQCCAGTSIDIDTKEVEVDIDAENIARVTRVVYYQGKPVKMIVAVWE